MLKGSCFLNVDLVSLMMIFLLSKRIVRLHVVVVGKFLHVIVVWRLDSVRYWRGSNVARLVLKTPRFKEPLAVLCSYLDWLLIVKARM